MSQASFYETIATVNMTEFLSWLKQRTEIEWAEYRTIPLDVLQREHRAYSDWRPGTKWSSNFSEKEIDRAEQKWKIKFPPDYRLFLSLLGIPDRYMFRTQVIDNQLVQEDTLFFYNWLTDENDIQVALNWPVKALMACVEQGVWHKNWGSKPDTLSARQTRVRKLISEAPPLVPVKKHSVYLVGLPLKEGNPLISINKPFLLDYPEIELAFPTLKSFLLIELAELLNVNRKRAFDESLEYVDPQALKAIPFWGEFLKFSKIR